MKTISNESHREKSSYINIIHIVNVQCISSDFLTFSSDFWDNKREVNLCSVISESKTLRLILIKFYISGPYTNLLNDLIFRNGWCNRSVNLHKMTCVTIEMIIQWKSQYAYIISMILNFMKLISIRSNPWWFQWAECGGRSQSFWRFLGYCCSAWLWGYSALMLSVWTGRLHLLHDASSCRFKPSRCRWTCNSRL